MSTEDELREKVASLEKRMADLQDVSQRRRIRKRSDHTLWGMPVYDIAVGPDPDNQEVRGHARGVIAIGDIATGLLAIGGLARGLFAIGGVALGGICLGGCSIGILVGVGGVATGAVALGGLAIGMIAIGGAAIGVVAIGGGAVGYYAAGGAAIGKYVISGAHQNPEAVDFFNQWIPGMNRLQQGPGE